MAMGKKEPAWKAYAPAVSHSIPRLTEGEELEHRAKLLYMRDKATSERHKSQWFDDQVLQTMASIITPYALSTRLRADQIKALQEVIADMAGVVSKLRAIGLDA